MSHTEREMCKMCRERAEAFKRMQAERHWSHRMIDEALCDGQKNDEKSNGTHGIV